MNKQINKKKLFILLMLITLALVSAFVIEHKLNHEPCELCIYQRIPYFLSILLIAKFFFISGYEKTTLLILSLVFIISTLLAFYHFGIEQGFFNESLVCAPEKLSETLTKDEILEQIKKNVISCNNVSFKIFGFSLATINTIFSFFLSVIFIQMFVKYEKN